MTSPCGDSESKKFNVIFVLGGPGSGKGTQCSNISKEFGYVHLSAGELLRKEKSDPGSEHGDLINTCMKEGTIVPVQITCRLIEKAMQDSGQSLFLIDGFPRNQDNLDGWNKAMSAKVVIQMVLFIECSDDICCQRCLSRGAGRLDDNEETLKKRLIQFKNECKSVIDHFRNENLVFKVNGDLSQEEVFEQIKKKMSTFQ